MEASMKWRFAALGPLVILVLCSLAFPIQAQMPEASTKAAVSAWYDLTKEVTLTGTVSSVVKAATRDMKTLGGSHLIVETTSGQVDASLGKLAMRGDGALSVAPGERVQLTGVMETVKDKQVLLTRLVQVNGHEYKIRNEHGYAIAVSRKNSANTGAKGGQL